MTQTGTRRFCFPAFNRRIFFAAGLFFDISSTFSDSSDGRITAALGLVCEQLLQGSITHRGRQFTSGMELDQLLFNRLDTLGLYYGNACQS